MKLTIALASLTGLIASAQAQYFGLMSLRSASPIHFQSFQAAGQRIWLGGDSAHYCPSFVQELGDCPNTDYTNFVGGGEGVPGALAMGTIVPGGQMVYIDPVCGAVRYTQAHSAYMPNGSITTGWTRTPSSGNGLEFMSWEGVGDYAGKGGLIACNGTEDAAGRFAVYADIGVTPPGYCLGFDTVVTGNSTSAAAWQYT